MNKKLLIMFILITTYSFANGPQNNSRQGRENREPPKEAIIACESKSEGTSCNVITPRGDTLNGTCKNTPDNKYFVCMPENMENNRPPNR